MKRRDRTFSMEEGCRTNIDGKEKDVLEGKEVVAYFENHPEAKEIVENTEVQDRCWQPGLQHEDMYRPLKLDDVRYISFGGWFGESGVFAWYYPCGVPHYLKIGEEE